MYYFVVFLVVLASPHILAHSHYLKKRTYSGIGHHSEECNNPYHSHNVIIHDEPFINGMTSDEYIAHHAKAKAARIRRLRKLKRLSDSYWGSPLFDKNRIRGDRNDHDDISSVNKNINKNNNRNVDNNGIKNDNRNVNRYKNRPKVLQKKRITPADRLEVIELVNNYELVDHHDHDRTVNFGMDNSRRNQNRKRVDRDRKRSSSSGNISSTPKNNVPLDVEELDEVTTSSTSQSTIKISTPSDEIYAENASGDIATSTPREDEEILEDTTKKQKQNRLQLKKQRDSKRNHQEKSKIRDEIINKEVKSKLSSLENLKTGKQRVGKRKGVKFDRKKDSGNISESRLSHEDGEKYEINNRTTKSPLKKNSELNLDENLDERNRTIPSLRSLLPKFKEMERPREPRWSWSNYGQYAVDASKSNNSKLVPLNRISQDNIDPEYLPEIHKPIKRTKNINKNKNVNKNKNINKNININENNNINKHKKIKKYKNVNVIGESSIASSKKHRPRNKYKASTIDFPQTINKDDDNDDDDDDDEDGNNKRPREIVIHQRSLIQNVNRNVNVNDNTNDHQDSSEESNEQINVNKFVSHRRALEETSDYEDSQSVNNVNVNKNINKNENNNVNINRNVNRRRPKSQELTQKELDNLLEKYEDEENRNYIHESDEYY